MSRFLLDANLSPRTSSYLRETFGFDVVDLVTLGLTDLKDDEVVEMAMTDRRIIVTEDVG